MRLGDALGASPDEAAHTMRKLCRSRRARVTSRGVADGFELCDAPLPAVAAVKEGINLPRYPAMRGRLIAKKAQIRHLQPTRRPGGLTLTVLRQPAQQETETVILGSGAEAAPAVAQLFEEVGVL
jgi:electron transfer flavoprotein beta subunit